MPGNAELKSSTSNSKDYMEVIQWVNASAVAVDINDNPLPDEFLGGLFSEPDPTFFDKEHDRNKSEKEFAGPVLVPAKMLSKWLDMTRLIQQNPPLTQRDTIMTLTK